MTVLVLSRPCIQKLERFQILEGRFQIDEIIRVNRKNDEHTISNKTFDFSAGTIKLLLEQGYTNAHQELAHY